MATSETWKDPSGEKKSKTEWHNIVAWNKLAEVVGKNFKKGMELFITNGKIEYTKGKNPADESKEITYTHIKMLEFDFCGKKGDGNGGYGTPDPEETGYQGSSSGSSVEDGPSSDTNGGGTTSNSNYDDDIPF